jgi:hypothetical protein
MTVRAALAFAAVACALTPAVARAGPCTDEIYRADLAINARLDAAAAKGKTGTESTFATMNRQPTPATVAAAEAKLGDVPEAEVKGVREYMQAARSADEAGDKPACEKALAQARSILGM